MITWKSSTLLTEEIVVRHKHHIWHLHKIQCPLFVVQGLVIICIDRALPHIVAIVNLAFTWVLKENIIQKLLVFERKILRGIFGPTKENQTWRIKNNEELDKLIKHENIVNHIKAQILSWFGRKQRIPETRAAKKIFKWNPLTT